MSLWPAFLNFFTTVAELGGPGSESDDAPLVIGAIADDPAGCSALCDALETLKRSENLPPLLAQAVSGFDREKLRKRVEGGAKKGCEMVRKRAAELLLQQAEPGPKPKLPVGGAKAEQSTTKDGVPREATTAKDGPTEADAPDGGADGGTTPKDPPTIYGEVLDSEGYAISIDIVHCVSETSDGPGSDEITWVAEITQVFNTPTLRVVETLVSKEYVQLDEGDRYSAINTQIVSDDTGQGSIRFQTDDRLCPRLWTTASAQGRQRLTLDTLSVFVLDHFDLCRIQLQLVEVDESKTVEAIIAIFTTLLNLGLQSAGGVVGLANAIAAATGASQATSTELVQQLRVQILRLLSQENDPLGTQTVIIRREDIRAAFPAGSTPTQVAQYGFVKADAIGKTMKFQGDGGEYDVHLRYEKWGSPD